MDFPFIVSLSESAPYPKAQIDSFDSGVLSFSWLDESEVRVDGGGSTVWVSEEEPILADFISAISSQASPPGDTPQEVGAGQIRAAMIASGIAQTDEELDGLIEAALNSVITDQTQRSIAIALWRYAGGFKRHNAFILAAQVALQKTDSEIDDLFRLAAQF
jgi:hypothetical protein